MICSKVVVLSSIYIFAIMCTHKKSLDPLQNRAQNSSQNTVSLNFRPQAVWQSNLGWDFLHISHKNMAWILKQSCSPIIGLQTCCGHFGQKPYALKVTKPQSWANITEISDLVYNSNEVHFAIESKTWGLAFKSTYLWTKGLKNLIWLGFCTLVQKWTNFAHRPLGFSFRVFPGFQLGFLVSQGYKCDSTLFLGIFYDSFPKVFRFSHLRLSFTPLTSI
jgi:hypothetical protein